MSPTFHNVVELVLVALSTLFTLYCPSQFMFPAVTVICKHKWRYNANKICSDDIMSQWRAWRITFLFHVKSKILMAVSIKVMAFWYVMLCRLVNGYQHFRGSCCFNLQCRQRGQQVFLKNTGTHLQNYTESKSSSLFQLPIYIYCCSSYHMSIFMPLQFTDLLLKEITQQDG